MINIGTVMRPLPYYPQQFRQSRPYYKETLAAATPFFQAGAVEGIQREYSLLMEQLAPRFLAERRPHDKVTPELFLNLTRESMIGLSMLELDRYGSRLLHVAPELVEAFLHSDSDEIALEDLHLPFTAFYLHLGRQDSLPLNQGKVYLQGALIRRIGEQGLRVTLAGAWPQDPPHDWRRRNEEIYDLMFRAPLLQLPVKDAIEAALAEDRADIESRLQELKRTLANEDARALADTLLHNLEANRSALAAACNVIVNTLCYLTSYADDQEERWPQEAPTRLAWQADTGSPTERRRAESKLRALGFTRVLRVGQQFVEANTWGATALSPHWRRGHWRRQAHGPRLSLRKLLWIKPARVLGGNHSAEDRVYTVNITETGK